jgi:hypothetical protein
MRTRFSATLVLLAAAAILSPAAAAHASDERRSVRVGSVDQFRGAIMPDSAASAVLAAPPKSDPLGNGIGIGAAIGAATGLGLMAWAYNQCEGSCDAPEPAPMHLMAGGFGAAVGGVVGWIVDAARKTTNRRVVLGGVVAPRRSQVRVTVSW